MIIGNESGWMTQEAFPKYATFFCTWVHNQRAAHRFSPTEKLCLLLDGHRSRECYAAINLFLLSQIVAATFPSQVTHTMQPVDVGIGAPFRLYYRQILRSRKAALKAGKGVGGHLTANEKRSLMIRASIDAVQQASISANRESTFSATGLFS
jgi:hypothetical protein